MRRRDSVAGRRVDAAADQCADHRVLDASTPLALNDLAAAFVQRLRELGWIEDRTVTIDYRWAEGRCERYAEIAADFVRLKVDIIDGSRQCTIPSAVRGYSRWWMDAVAELGNRRRLRRSNC